MNCNETQLLADHMVDGELTEELQAAVERHLLRCQACREEIGDLRSLQQSLTASFPCEALSDDVRQAALDRIAVQLVLPAGAPPRPGQLVLFTDVRERGSALSPLRPEEE